jgi:flagellar basal body P-ring formation protein FlgA
MRITPPENKRFFVLLISLGLIIGSLSNASGLEITVKQSAVVKGELIRLGDIAQFDPMSDSRVSQLSLIEISSAPMPGTDSNISKDLMIYKINSFISGSKDILIKLPESLIVHRGAQLINAGRMQEIFTEYIKNHSEWPEDKISFEDINTPGTIALPVGNLRWDVQGKSSNDLIGNVSLTIDFRVDDKLVKKVPVSGKVSINMETIKAARRIERGRVISADDITLVNENSFHFRKDSIINKEDVIGKRALHTIQADQTFLASMIENPPLVKKGDKVIIKAENSEFKITAPGEALQDGQTGDQVEVLNLQSGGKVFATVRGSGLVEVFF